MQKTILVAEDDKNISNLIKEMIERKGYKAITAKNGAEAYRAYRKTRFDLLITDIKMPEMDGLTFIKMVREQDKAIPILIITAYSSERNRALAKGYGVSGILQKPFTVLDVSRAIESAINPPE